MGLLSAVSFIAQLFPNFSLWPLFPDVFLSCSPSFAPKSAVLISLCACVWCTSAWVSAIMIPLLFISSLVVLDLQCQLQLSPSRPSQRSVLETRSVGGRQLHARHTLGRVLWAFLPFKPLQLFSSLTPFFFFPPLFSLSSCSGGKTYGAVYLFWFGVGSHMSLAGFHTSMTVAWIARDYHDIMCARVSI